MRRSAILCLCLGASAVACVRAEDLEAWVGQPVAVLETHPVFVTMPLVRTQASDGTEIWNYVSGAAVTECEATARGGRPGYTSYTQFANCLSTTMACNNLFYVRNGRVLRYAPVGSGGANCYTDSRLQPYFQGPTNIK